MMSSQQPWVYGFGDGDASMRALLGNKGANLAEMTRLIGADRVPGGFTVTTEACVAYMRNGSAPADLDRQIDEQLAALELAAGRRFGDADDPLLLSVRSGAPVSMPGMLDTILNLGLSEAATLGLAHTSGEPAFAWDRAGASCRCSARSSAASPPNASRPCSAKPVRAPG